MDKEIILKIRLANIMGLDINNSQHSVGINEALFGIEDTNSFLEFCVDKKDGIEYTTKPERLMILANRYKKLQEDAKLPHNTAGLFTTNITNKVSEARTYIKNLIEQGEDRPFSRLLVDGHPFFTEKEINALSEIGSSPLILELSEQGILHERLLKIFMDKFRRKASYTSLTDGQKRIKKLLSV